ncbi:uncharacterized protein [Elaeis guineensis]|uniref:Uncharacterized protein LOC105032215 n=1 Tax=Elaeis guineensis var. tenera TaxID=51953 RepID=A0A6I9Q8X8_ELAGV|nr:uncharacterized protein LOC105032215 [Elaeis guineensis]
MRKSKTVGGGERPESYRSGSELFISFAARSTSAAAAMRVTSSKSLLSPGRGRDPAAPSLSASLSKRLRSSGSLKGGQSPMFSSVAAAGGGGGGGRRKGCALEAVEPSSPKVTCIGQVRVKSKKKKAKAKAAAMARSRSKRGSGKEASFRRTEEECWPRKNQRWVYQLPVSICEGLRAFGTEFNCFLPCGSSPCSSSRTGEEKRGECEEKRNTSSCGHVLARWLMAMQEGEERKRGQVVGLMVEERGKRELDLVMEEREKREVEGVEVGNGNGAEKKDEVLAAGEAEEARVSACIPPRNALLLMRCRSDPVRMAALANRFWGSPATKVEVEEEEEEEGEEADVEVGQHLFGLVEVDREKIGAERDEAAIAAAKAGPETGEVYIGETQEERSSQGVILRVDLEEMGSLAEEKQQRSSEERQDGNEIGGESLKEGPSADCVDVQRNPPRDVEGARLLEKSEEIVLQEETHMLEREEEKERKEEKGRRSSSCSSSMGKEERRSHSHKCLSKAKEGASRRGSSLRNKEKRRHSFSTARDERRYSFSHEREARRASFSIEGKRRWSFSIDKEELIPEEENALHEEEEKKEEDSSVKGGEVRKAETLEKPKATEDEEVEVNGGGRREEENGKVEEGIKGNEGKEGRELPDCLLLMMYEPKLSMEVSKETWVCSTDFHRWRPHHHRHLPKGSGGDGGGGGRGGGEGDRAKTEKVVNGENTEVTAPAEPTFLQAAPPPRPPVPPTASAIEQKLMGVVAPSGPKPPAAAYEPFVLTRCKSEPIRSSARLAPDACFWKDGHRPIGATGIGF